MTLESCLVSRSQLVLFLPLWCRFVLYVTDLFVLGSVPAVVRDELASFSSSFRFDRASFAFCCCPRLSPDSR